MVPARPTWTNLVGIETSWDCLSIVSNILPYGEKWVIPLNPSFFNWILSFHLFGVVWYLAFWTCLSFKISQCSAQLRPRDRPCCFWLADAHQSTSWRKKSGDLHAVLPAEGTHTNQLISIPIGSMYAILYMLTFTINIPQMLAYRPAPWILWDIWSINDQQNIDQHALDWFCWLCRKPCSLQFVWGSCQFYPVQPALEMEMSTTTWLGAWPENTDICVAILAKRRVLKPDTWRCIYSLAIKKMQQRLFLTNSYWLNVSFLRYFQII